MSAEEAELALLHQMQAGQENVAVGNIGSDGTAAGELPSNTEDNNQEEKQTVADDQELVQRAFPASGSIAVSDGGDSILSSITTASAGANLADGESRSSSRASQRKPKTVGGFIADDSDEEYEASTATQSSTGLQVPATNNSTRTISPSPLHNSITQQDLPTNTDNQDATETGSTSVPSLTMNTAVAPPASTTNGTAPKARLPHDRIGILEDKIKEDPRGDTESWLALIDEHRKRNKFDEARAVYERFFEAFPQASDVWVQYVDMELEIDNFTGAEKIFGRSLMQNPNVKLWSAYLDYIRRRNDLSNDATGNARTTVSLAYDFVLKHVGVDRLSGKIWEDYLAFLHVIPGTIGGDSWQDRQKVDTMRKAYQRATSVPMSAVGNLWKLYNDFETNLNRTTSRKFIQERSPNHMTARSANTALENITRGLSRTTIPQLPPAHGFEGDAEFLQQIDIWKKWIAWEQEDPLVLKGEDPALYKERILYAYKQACITMRFWPEMWVEAADWCFTNGMKEGDEFLDNGIAANPESCLLAFKKGDRLESTLSTLEAEKGPAERGAIVRAPYDKLLDSLYDLVKQLKVRETAEFAKVEEAAAMDENISAIIAQAGGEDDEQDAERKVRDDEKSKKMDAIRQGFVVQGQLISKLISFGWIALMRAMRRVQGKGAVKDAVGGSRQIFADARARGKITSDVYVASALIEHKVYKDVAGTKIFERGSKLFPEDGPFILEYLKHLISIGDITNARAAFETSVSRLTAKPELVSKAKPLYAYFHKYESQYGELPQIAKLEQRMAEIFPDDPKLARFASRYSADDFDPIAVRPIISPATQMRPKNIMQSIEQAPSVVDSPRPRYLQEPSPRPQYVQTTNSPKRPFPTDELDNDRPRKLARGESPLKGAAGRRLDQQKRMQQGAPQWQSNAPPFVVPRDITFLLSLIPKVEFFPGPYYNPEAAVRFLSQVHVPDSSTYQPPRVQHQQPPHQMQYQQPQQGYSGYGNGYNYGR